LGTANLLVWDQKPVGVSLAVGVPDGVELVVGDTVVVGVPLGVPDGDVDGVAAVCCTKSVICVLAGTVLPCAGNWFHTVPTGMF
jgi:hypothetical protein